VRVGAKMIPLNPFAASVAAFILLPLALGAFVSATAGIVAGLGLGAVAAWIAHLLRDPATAQGGRYRRPAGLLALGGSLGLAGAALGLALGE
jgi:hypothetical protein